LAPQPRREGLKVAAAPPALAPSQSPNSAIAAHNRRLFFLYKK
jgi:hypothetical protein